MGAAAGAALDVQLLEAIAGLEKEGDLGTIRTLYERGSTWGYHAEQSLLSSALAEALQRTIGRLAPEVDIAGLAAHTELLLDAAALVGAAPDFWQAQNQLLDAAVRLTDLGVMDDQLRTIFARLATRLKIGEHLLGWRP
jgi:hypothetical protein